LGSSTGRFPLHEARSSEVRGTGMRLERNLEGQFGDGMTGYASSTISGV